MAHAKDCVGLVDACVTPCGEICATTLILCVHGLLTICVGNQTELLLLPRQPARVGTLQTACQSANRRGPAGVVPPAADCGALTSQLPRAVITRQACSCPSSTLTFLTSMARAESLQVTDMFSSRLDGCRWRNSVKLYTRTETCTASSRLQNYVSPTNADTPSLHLLSLGIKGSSSASCPPRSQEL